MPALTELKLTPFTVVGRINSGAFQKAKAVVAACDAAASATVIALMPTDYKKYLVSLSAQYGGPAYAHEEGVAVFSEQAGWIGDDAGLLKWLKANGVGGIPATLNSKGRGKNWDDLAEEEFQKELCESERTYAFIELATESDGVLGRLVFELYPDLAPKTCDNFLALCAAEKSGYVGSAIHRIKPRGWMQGGDVLSGNGDGGAAASGSAIPDESFHVKHSEYGILGMANSGKVHSAQSQFYVTFAACPSFDGLYCAFGKLVDGHKLLSYLEDSDCANERPRAHMTVSAAGKVLPFVSAGKAATFYEDEDAAAAKLQAMHKARAQRKENEERKKAAMRVQAAKRGKKAREQTKAMRAEAVAQ